MTQTYELSIFLFGPVLRFYVDQFIQLVSSADRTQPELILAGGKFGLIVNLKVDCKAELAGASGKLMIQRGAVYVMLFLIIGNLGLAQPPNSSPDSLAHYLKTAHQDTNYVRTVNRYVSELYYQHAVPLIDSMQSRNKHLAIRLGDHVGLYQIYLMRSHVKKLIGQTDSALIYLKKAHNLITKFNLPETKLLPVLAQYGTVYFVRNHYETALKYHLAAIELAEKSRMTDYVLQSYLEVYQILEVTGRKNESCQYIKKAYPIALRDVSKNWLFDTEIYTARCLAQENNPQKQGEAIYHVQLALKANVFKFPEKNCEVLIEFGRLNINQKQYNKALRFLKQALKISKNNKLLPYVDEELYAQLGRYYQCMNKCHLAEIYYRRSIEIAHKYGWVWKVRDINAFLAQLYAQSNQYKKAFQYQLHFSHLNDSLLSNEVDRKTRDLISQQEKEQNQARILRLNEQNQRTRFERNALLIGSLLLVALTIAVGAWLLNRARLRRLEEAQQLRQQLAHDLHDDMGSTLSSISLLSSMSNDMLHQAGPAAETPELVQRMVAKIFIDTRRMQETIDELIWMVKPGNDSLFQIAVRIRVYAEPLLVSKGIKFKFSFDPSLEHQPVSLEIRRNLYLLGKEAINNAVKYAQATQVTLRFDYQYKQLIVLIDDNGRGFDPVASTTRTGLQSMHQRAKAMGGSLSIYSVPRQGTSLKLTVAV